MKVITHKVTLESSAQSDEVVFVVMGDLHIGAKNVDYPALRADIATIADHPEWRVILMGDLVNAQDRKHHHYSESEHAEWLYGKNDILLEERIFLGELMKPIAQQKQIIAYVTGNHEENAKNYGNRDMYYECADELTRPYGRNAGEIMIGYNGFIQVQFTHKFKSGAKGVNSSLTFFAHHGHGGGSAHSSVVNKLSKLMEAYEADVYLQGHHHKSATHKTHTMGVTSRGRLEVKKKIAYGVASYMRTHAEGNADGTPNITYAERKAYAPVGIGATVITHRPRRGTMPPLTTSITGDYERLSEIVHKI